MATESMKKLLSDHETQMRLRALAARIRDWLTDDAPGAVWSKPRSDKPERTANDGWYVAVAGPQSGGGMLELFYDDIASKELPHLYYGFCASSAKRIREIAEIGTPIYGDAIVDNEERDLEPDEFGCPFREHIGPGEYYYGIYHADPLAILADAEAQLVPRIGGFFVDIAAALDAASSDSRATAGGEKWPKKRKAGAAAQRPGQGKFRGEVLGRFRARCCVSDCGVVRLLEAAHIRTIDGADDNSPGNGLLLRVDLHRLFDLGLLAVHPRTLQVRLHESLRNTEYGRYDGVKLQAPDGALEALSRDALRDRWARRIRAHMTSN